MDMLTQGAYVLTCNEDRYQAFVERQEAQGWLLGVPEKWVNRSTSDPKTACRRGHRDIIKDAVDKHLDSVLILEDDVLFRNDVRSKLQQAFSSLDSFWDAIWLGGNSGKKKGYVDGIWYVERIYTTHAYLLSGRILDDCYDYLANSSLASDVALMDFLADKNLFAFMPSLAGQAAGFSEVLGRYREERWYE